MPSRATNYSSNYNVNTFNNKIDETNREIEEKFRLYIDRKLVTTISDFNKKFVTLYLR